MSKPEHFKRLAIAEVAWITRNGTRMVRVRGHNPNPTLPPVISLHGWSADSPGANILDGATANTEGTTAALMATGRTQYTPWCGANWGRNTITYPSLGGTGRKAIDDCLEQAAADGLDTSTVDLIGTSAGGCNTLNWAWRNPTKVHAIYLEAPVVNLVDVYRNSEAFILDHDFPSIRESMRQVHGGTDEATWLPLSAPFDPYRNMNLIAPFGNRIFIWSARDDSLIDWSTLVLFATEIGAQLHPSGPPGTAGGDHFFTHLMAAWNDLMPLRHFTGTPQDQPLPT